MADATVTATMIINAPAKAVFALLADPHQARCVDGAGWVREPVDSQPLTAAGQVFRMAMYHANHPDGNYQVANRVQVFDPPRAISWEPGQEVGDGDHDAAEALAHGGASAPRVGRQLRGRHAGSVGHRQAAAGFCPAR